MDLKFRLILIATLCTALPGFSSGQLSKINDESTPKCTFETISETEQPGERTLQMRFKPSCYHRESCEQSKITELQAAVTAQVRITCTARKPIFVDFRPMGTKEKFVSYSGMSIQFSKSHHDTQGLAHVVRVEFPKVAGIVNETLWDFQGLFEFYKKDHGRRTPLYFVNFIVEGERPKLEPATTEIGRPIIENSDFLLTCTSTNPKGEIYMTGLGGESVNEIEMNKHCLTKSEYDCSNKLIGISCVQNRFCKKMELNINQNGIVYCNDGNSEVFKPYFTGLDLTIHFLEGTAAHDLNSRYLIRMYEDDEQRTRDVDSEFPYSIDSTPIPESQEFENRKQPKLNVTAGKTEKFECHFVSYLLVHPVTWFVEYNDGRANWFGKDEGGKTSHEYRQVEGGNEGTKFQMRVKSSHASLLVTSNMTRIGCQAFFWDTQTKVTALRELDVVAGKHHRLG